MLSIALAPTCKPRLAGADHHRDAPATVEFTGQDHAIPILDAEEETTLELIENDNRLRALKHGRRNGRFRLRLELLENSSAGLDSDDDVVP
jgi:hypothetical protein